MAKRSDRKKQESLSTTHPPYKAESNKTVRFPTWHGCRGRICAREFRKAAQRRETATTGSLSSSRVPRTAFSSRRLTAISAMFEGLPLRAGRFAFSALGTDCSLVLISSARYLDCRNRGTRFLLRDFARGLSSRRGKHPEQQGKQEKHKPLRGKSVHACFMLRLISTGSARPIQREAPATADRHRKKFGAFSRAFSISNRCNA